MSAHVAPSVELTSVTRLHLHAILFLLILSSCVKAQAQSAPNISSISPTVGQVSPVGSPATIKGTGFGATQGSSTVTFGGVAATPTSRSDTKIVAPVPSSLLPGFVSVVVAVGGTASNAPSFLVIPAIAGCTPCQGNIGTAVTLTGTSFGSSQGSSTVTFNGTTASPSSWHNTSITVPAPMGASDGPIVATINGFATNGVQFYVTPNILGLQPRIGPVGTSLTISGNGFGQTQNVVSGVMFNGTSATIASWSDTSIVAAVPPGATSGNVVVTAGNDLVSSGVNFTVSASGPSLLSIAVTPANAPAIIAMTQQFTATGTYSDNSTQDLTSTATWASSNPAAATINSVGVATTNAQGTTTITATLGSISGSTVLTITPGSFVPVGSLSQPRWQHTATLLPNGKVLIVGGINQNQISLASAELYDPVTRHFTSIAPLNTARENHTATLLPNGKVLIAGGGNYNASLAVEFALSSAELYDPSTGTFSTTGNLTTIRDTQTATLLQNGKVLLVGGGAAVAELYDLATGKFTATGSNVVPRNYHTASLLNNGTVLIAGGMDGSFNRLASAEIYDSATGSFTTTGSLGIP